MVALAICRAASPSRQASAFLADRRGAGPLDHSPDFMRVAFFLEGFPKLSETFILNQITGLIDRGIDVHIYASRPAPGTPTHPEVAQYGLLSRTHYRDSRPTAGSGERLSTLQLAARAVSTDPAMPEGS